LEGTITLEDLSLVNETNFVRVVQDQELNVVLLKLLDYLGHTNPIVSGVAFNEVSSRILSDSPS
jgi:serine/threonine-protein kinase ATR